MGTEIKRKLAEIARITNISPIEGADKIEVAQVMGWETVVQKGIHNVGDLVVYFSIDSVLPEIPEFEFLRKNCYVTAASSVNGAGFRLKTIRLRGQVSQGLIVPIRELFRWEDCHYVRTVISKVHRDENSLTLESQDYYLDPEEGDDVTDVLGVVKFERPISPNLAGKARGNFPTFIPKTDQDRIQGNFKKFDKNRDDDWEVTIKLDGSSATFYFDSETDRFGVCSRNLDLIETEDNAFWQVARKYDIENKFRETANAYAAFDMGPLKMAIQGELMGPKVQGNREGFDDLRFFVFDIYDFGEQRYYNSHDRRVIADSFNLEHVPVVDTTKFDFTSPKQFIELAETGYHNGKSINNPIREGLVFKSVQHPEISFKAISNIFLMSGGE